MSQQQQQQINDLSISLEQNVANEGNNKDKNSDNKRFNGSQNDESVTPSAPKSDRTRSTSIDSKASSSWFWRSSKQPQATSQEQHMEQGENNNPNGASKPDNGTESSGNTMSGNGSNGDDNYNNDGSDDNSDDSSDKKNGTKSETQEQPASGGLWSWLGYSTTEQKPNIKEDNERDDNNTVVSSQSLSQQTSRSQSTASTTIPVIQPSVETTQTDPEQEYQQQRPNNNTSENRTYWKSFFWSSQSDGSNSNINNNSNNNNNNSPDTVGIEKSSSTETRTSTTTADTPAIVIPKSYKRNVVVPTIESQLYPPSETPEHHSTSLLNKALKAINSLFAQKSPHHVNTKFAKFIDDMKARPEDIAGKKFVIVGVHGWFPTKVHK